MKTNLYYLSEDEIKFICYNQNLNYDRMNDYSNRLAAWLGL